mmetsp:Transcript_46998/g.121341  ORF Transcript_46998/g.121341 Transcript_46998/m.121341 type:complete len:209 (-) Transcript_46998:539-1165(-)
MSSSCKCVHCALCHTSTTSCTDTSLPPLFLPVFQQEGRYKEAIRYYSPIVSKHEDDILSVQAIVLANLCVSYIMTSQNEEAEELMRKIEKEEEQLAYQDPNKQIFHLCIVNLVIGTLYCAKGNFEFGISRIIKSLEPYNRKLGADTWFYAKRCFLALIDTLAKHMILLKDSTYAEIMVRRKGGKGFGVHQCEVPAFTSATALSSFRMH